MAGLWVFTSSKAFFKYLLAVVIVSGLPTLVLVTLIPMAIENAAVSFLLKALGATWGGFALIMPMSIIHKRY